MKRDLRGLRALVTGATSGIGQAIATQALAAGMRLMITGRSQDKLAAMVREFGSQGELHTHVADLTSEDDRCGLVRAAVASLGGLDVLINNAGVASFGHFATSQEEVLRTIMEVNFFAPAELMRLAQPHLMAGRTPAIVNVASMCGRCAMPAWPEYSASKFGLCGLTEALRGEYARFDIAVLTVLPGLTQSSLGDHLLRRDGKMRIDFKEGMPTTTVAKAVLDALRSNRSETVIGSDARKMLLVQKLFPRWLNWMIARRVKQLYAAPAEH